MDHYQDQRRLRETFTGDFNGAGKSFYGLRDRRDDYDDDDDDHSTATLLIHNTMRTHPPQYHIVKSSVFDILFVL